MIALSVHQELEFNELFYRTTTQKHRESKWTSSDTYEKAALKNARYVNVNLWIGNPRGPLFGFDQTGLAANPRARLA